MFHYKTYGDLSSDIAANLQKIPETDIVVGIPKSGLIPSTIIASFLNKAHFDLDSFLFSYSARKGSRKVSGHAHKLQVLLVDDSVNSGNEFRRVSARIQHLVDHFDFSFCAIYGTGTAPENSPEHITLMTVPQPRVFQWNYRNHIIAEHALFDMDGVLCADPIDEQNDDGEKYINFILNAPVLVVPKKRISAIVTSRLEKFRSYTEEWLHKNGVNYKELIMLDLPSAEERRRLRAHAPFKAEVYKSRDEILFVESNWKQARAICNEADKAVICTENDVLLWDKRHLRIYERGDHKVHAQDPAYSETLAKLSSRILEIDPFAQSHLGEFLNSVRRSPDRKTQWDISRALQAAIAPRIVSKKGPSTATSGKRRIAMVVTTFDIKRGAGAAASSERLRDTLIGQGHEVLSLSLDAHRQTGLESADQPLSGTHIGFWNSYYGSEPSKNVREQIEAFKPDCIVLGTIDRGILSVADLASLRHPIVWIARDNWSHTGGCLFKLNAESVTKLTEYNKEFTTALTCDGYKSGCKDCPAIIDRREAVKASFNYEIKQMILEYRKDIVFCAISDWLADFMREAPLTRNHHIHVAYNPIPSQKIGNIEFDIRKKFSLPEGSKLVLMAAHSSQNPRKGFDLAIQAINEAGKLPGVYFVIMGSDSVPGKLAPEVAKKCLPLGFISDTKIKSEIMNQIDVALVPTMQETLSVVASDAIRVGCPVVCYRVSGLTSFLAHKENSYQADPFDMRDLAVGLIWALDDANLPALKASAYDTGERFFDPDKTVANFMVAVERAIQNYKNLPEMPLHIQMLDHVLQLVEADNAFRHMHTRYHKKVQENFKKELTASRAENELLNVKLSELSGKLEWNRKKRELYEKKLQK